MERVSGFPLFKKIPIIAIIITKVTDFISSFTVVSLDVSDGAWCTV